MVNSDPYSEARQLAHVLSNENLAIWAEKLSDCIAGGSTATEILMCLRWTLKKLLDAQPLRDETRTAAIALLNRLNSCLSLAD